MRAAQRHVGISLGVIDSLSDGLGEFSTQLCERIAVVAAPWREELGVQFHVHLPERWEGRFGPHVDYLVARKSQGYLHWQGLRRFDVWHALNQLGRILPPMGTLQSLLTIHDLNSLYHDSPAAVRRHLSKLKRRLRHFDEVSTLTRHVEGDIRQHLHWPGPITIVPNGARDLTVHAQTAVAGVVPGRYLLHLSRMAASKNPQSLLELASIWPEQSFVLAGPRCGDSDALREQAQVRGLHNVQVVQEVSDSEKTWLYAHCQGFLFPSWTEGFGLPPLEAMHFGKPVYLARCTSLPEIGGNKAGYFDDFHPQAMRRVIEAEQPRLLSEADAIRCHAGEFTWERSVQGYLAIYRRMLAFKDRKSSP